MKLRNFLIVLFAILMVFAFASCKNEPKEEPKPTPKPQPVVPDYYQIEVTEGVDKDYWNRDKIKIEWEEEVNAGDVVSLKYRSERDVYQWDIRDGSLKWVYETKKGSFTDPVLGEDGWWTLTYTFANDINGAAVDSNERFGIYFRGNYVTTDLFEIKDITLNGEPLEITQDNIKSYAVLNDTEDHPLVEHDWSKKNWSVLFATGTVGEVDKTPLAEKVLDGGLVTGAPVNKEGYTLSIFTDADRTTAFDATQPITENKIFYYSYVGVPRALTFVLNGGAFEEGAEVPATVLNGDMLPEIPEPVLATKAFKAWYKDAELTTPWEATDTVLGDLTLYAAYGEPATVTFDAQNGEETHVTKLVAIGNPVKMPETPEKELHMFLGWYTDAEGTTLYDFSTPVTADITVYAKWALPANVTLNLNYAEAGEPEVVQVALNTAMEEPEAPSRTGFIFEGWYTTAECTTAYNFALPVSADTAIYAKWGYGTMYRVTATKFTDGYNHDKFVLGFADAKVKAGDVLSISYRTTEDFTWFSVRKNDPDTYSKWFHEKSSGTWPLFFSSKTTSEDGWTTITYEFPEPTDSTQAKQIGYGDEGTGFFVYLGNSKMVPGAFAEFRAVTINGVEVEFTDATINHALTQTAPTWEVVETPYEWADQTVKYNTDGGTAIADAAVKFGKRAERPAEDPVKADVLFIDWYADAEFTTLFDFTNTPITSETTIYARYGAPTVVAFNSQGGSDVISATVPAGTPVAKPADPTKESKFFAGWFTEAECTNAYDFKANVTESITLFAKWADPVNLTYNLNYDGAAEPTVIGVGGGLALTAPKNPSRAGYYFGGWYKEAGCTTEFDFAAGITEATTIYAKWNAPTKSYKYTVTSEAKDRLQFRWKSSSVSILSELKEGDTFTFMVKFTPSAGAAPTNFRLRNTSESDIGFKYTAFPAAGADGWIAVTATLTQDYSGNGLLLGLYCASQASNIKAGDICEIKAVAFNGVEIPISTSSTSSGLYPGAEATVEVIDL